MKVANKRDLIRAIDVSTKELHQRIDMHRYLMARILEQRLSSETIKQICLPTDCPDKNRLKEAVREAIEVLEESRKAFKSKRLEALRKKLTQVLIETE